MKPLKSTQAGLDAKFHKVEQTPAGFGLYVAIHDFIEYIEDHAPLVKDVTKKDKLNKELDIPTKYAFLKTVYQGLEDINSDSKGDLGHNRYSVIRELTRIKNNDVSESNSFWKKREVFRKLSGIVYKRLSAPEEIIV
jgi:hypothetical protein